MQRYFLQACMLILTVFFLVQHYIGQSVWKEKTAASQPSPHAAQQASSQACALSVIKLSKRTVEPSSICKAQPHTPLPLSLPDPLPEPLPRPPQGNTTPHALELLVRHTDFLTIPVVCDVLVGDTDDECQVT